MASGGHKYCYQQGVYMYIPHFFFGGGGSGIVGIRGVGVDVRACCGNV